MLLFFRKKSPIAKAFNELNIVDDALAVINRAIVLNDVYKEGALEALLVKYDILLKHGHDCRFGEKRNISHINSSHVSEIVDILRTVAPDSQKVQSAVELWNTATYEMLASEDTQPNKLNVKLVHSTDSLASLDIAICPIYRHPEYTLSFTSSFHGHHSAYALATLRSCARAFIAPDFVEMGIEQLRQEAASVPIATLRAEMEMWRHPDDSFNSNAKFGIDAANDNLTDSIVQNSNKRVGDDRSSIRAAFRSLNMDFDAQIGRFGASAVALTRCFPITADIVSLCRSIHRRAGNPKVIVLYGHGNESGMEAAYNDKNQCITSGVLVRAVRQFNPLPSAVVLLGCNTHTAAIEAHSLCPQILWLGSVAKLLRIDMFSGNSIIPRWLRRLHQIAVALRLRLPYVKMTLQWPVTWQSQRPYRRHRRCFEWQTENLCQKDIWELFLTEMIDQHKMPNMKSHLDALLFPGWSSMREIYAIYNDALQSPDHSLWDPLDNWQQIANVGLE